ncbi:MAG: 4Fe-4S binding protein [Lachnospiraceae bacterium]|nr:4Fe-4S binding protein [Lachnospiraceae bacterium]
MRQRIRKTLLIISFLLFPITIWYFSPYLIILAASEHIMNGSFIVFVAMFVLSMFFGRVWCGYFCPAGGLQECLIMCNSAPSKQGWRNLIKYVIWTIWILAIVITFILGKNDVTINPFYMTDHGISVSGIYNYLIYYGVILILVLPALIHGRRATCHYICWMAPFMVIGSTLGRILHFPQLYIEVDKDTCISCGKCNMSCPMGLDVKTMVSEKKNAKCTECIQCGACIDNCPKKVLKYKFRWR